MLKEHEIDRGVPLVGINFGPDGDLSTGCQATIGQKIFMMHITVQCIRCHKVEKTGSTAGPNLESIALKRDAKYLLRSIIAPSADIEPKYRSQTLILDSGKVIGGLASRKDDKVAFLANAEGKEIIVNERRRRRGHHAEDNKSPRPTRQPQPCRLTADFAAT